MKFLKTMAILCSLLTVFSTSAHISLTQSIPANDAMLMAQPEKLSLTFSGKVRVAKVTITNSNKEKVNFKFTPSAKLGSQFDWALPALSAGNYTVHWIVLGKDGHKMSDTFSFVLHGASKETIDDKLNSHKSNKH